MCKIKKILIYSLCTMVMCSFVPVISFASDTQNLEAVNCSADSEYNLLDGVDLENEEGPVVKADVMNNEGLMDVEEVNAFSTSAYTAKFCGFYDRSASEDLLVIINNARREKGLDALVWDCGYEDYLMDRAMELAISYSFTRPDGTKGGEFWHGYTDGSVTSFLEDELYLADPDDGMWNSDLKTCIPVVVVVGGLSYYAIGVSRQTSGDETPYYDSDDYIFSISVKDGYINPKSEFLNSSYNSATAKPTTTGKKFYYWIYNKNRYVEDAYVYFDQQYSHSSNTRVATIDKYGTVKTKGVGVAKLIVKPASASSKTFSRYIVVKPGKVYGVKLTTPKKKTIKVSWNKITGASGYSIYRSTKKSSGYKLVKTITNGSTKTWTNYKLKQGKNYYYKVRAYVKYDSKKYVGTYSAVYSKRTR